MKAYWQNFTDAYSQLFFSGAAGTVTRSNILSAVLLSRTWDSRTRTRSQGSKTRTRTWCPRTRTWKLVLEDKDFPWGPQHWLSPNWRLVGNSILSTQKQRLHHAWNSLKFISKTNGMYERNSSFRINIMEEIFQIRSYIEILVPHMISKSTQLFYS